MMRKFNTKLLALLLVLVFSQKLGLRLWMHHLLHESTEQKSSLPYSQQIQLKCDCVDEALMPFTETPSFIVAIPEREVEQIIYNYPLSFSSVTKLFCSLKGPPQHSYEL